MTADALSFAVPHEHFASAPPEARGLRRDEVKLLVASRQQRRHATFHDLPAHLSAGDLVVVNDSATIAAALDGHREDGRPVTVHVGAYLPDGQLVVELRNPARVRDGQRGEALLLAHGAQLRLTAAVPDDRVTHGSRLWRATLAAPDAAGRFVAANGRPIQYDYVPERWPLSAYQTVFSTRPGSVEMPSAGRPFTTEVVTDLVRRGISVVPLTLHTGLSSLEANESPMPEWFAVPAATARAVNATRAAGHRVVAVGTSVTRALESALSPDGRVQPADGMTNLVLGDDRPARVVTGLITGWHEAEASHLKLLEAVVGREVLELAYDEALSHDYLWHEFGDSALLLA